MVQLRNDQNEFCSFYLKQRVLYEMIDFREGKVPLGQHENVTTTDLRAGD